MKVQHAQKQSRRRGPLWLGAAAALVFVVSTSSVGPGVAGSSAMNIPKTLPKAARAAVESGVDTASVQFGAYADDWSSAVQRPRFSPPSALKEALRDVDDAVEDGVTLTEEEQRLIDSAKKWVDAYQLMDRSLKLAAGWNLSIRGDALELAAASFIREPTPAFRKHIEEKTEALLKGMMCKAARDALDELGQAQAEDAIETYEYIGEYQSDVEDYIDRAIENWRGAQDVINVVGLASASVRTHNARVDAIVDVIESPTDTIAAANVIYFRSCVLRK